RDFRMSMSTALDACLLLSQSDVILDCLRHNGYKKILPCADITSPSGGGENDITQTATGPCFSFRLPASGRCCRRIACCEPDSSPRGRTPDGRQYYSRAPRLHQR